MFPVRYLVHRFSGRMQTIHGHTSTCYLSYLRYQPTSRPPSSPAKGRETHTACSAEMPKIPCMTPSRPPRQPPILPLFIGWLLHMSTYSFPRKATPYKSRPDWWWSEGPDHGPWQLSSAQCLESGEMASTFACITDISACFFQAHRASITYPSDTPAITSVLPQLLLVTRRLEMVVRGFDISIGDYTGDSGALARAQSWVFWASRISIVAAFFNNALAALIGVCEPPCLSWLRTHTMTLSCVKGSGSLPNNVGLCLCPISRTGLAPASFISPGCPLGRPLSARTAESKGGWC